MDNSISATTRLLSLLYIQHTKYIYDALLSHPDHTSLLAITDTLDRYNIENLGIRIEAEKLDTIPVPCIVQVQDNSGSLFYVVKSITDQEVSYYDEKDTLINTVKADFLKIWTGICLLAETTKDSKEPNIEKTLAEKRTYNVLTIIIGVLFVGWMVSGLFSTGAVFSVSPIFYTILKLGGLAVGVLLLWFEIDQYNPTLQSFCQGGAGSKINCNAVLGSKYAKLFKGHLSLSLSLSLLVFSYFFSSLLYLTIYKFSIASLSLLGIISFATFPIVISSLYYQAVVIKQWCKFCIMVQIILIAEIALVFLGGFYKSTFSFSEFPLLGLLFLIPIMVWSVLKPLLENKKELNLYKRGLKKIKNNPDVLDGLLLKSRKIETSLEGLGISLTSTSAKYNVIKVCNPYCGPCAKAHTVLEGLVNAGKINLQILFTAKSSTDTIGKPVSHFLAIDAKGDKKRTQQALDEWYLEDKKDYEAFANKYPMNGELDSQNHKIEAMRTWCDAEKIAHTPTLFINGHELPREYSVEDLTDVLQ
ncbi:cysteine peptidase family C39 domain-containing protein [Algibacter sp. 2305UL17-15]|uniref:cysteine peptidase family C39 domain-containing protein n=1 Tax=Algibacter sp. 2305UL17-15 TaxID=3231268 RepID=UPI00345A9EEA